MSTPSRATKQLPEKFTRNRHQFEQLRRTENTAMYLQHIKGRQKAFEVIVIAVTDRRPVRVNGRVGWESCGPYERYPSSESWGTAGWTYTTFEAAREKYDELNQSGDLASKLRLNPPRAPLGFAQDALEGNGDTGVRNAAGFAKKGV